MGIDWALVGLFMAQLLANSVYSVIAPFFPDVASAKHIRPEVVGVIFSAYPIAAFITSPILGMFISKIGRKRTLLTGGTLIAMTMFGFGSLPLASGVLFSSLSFLTRFLQGVGGGIIGTAGYAIIASSYPDNMPVILGIQNTIAGIGMMLGPLLGSLLYELAGLAVLFFIYGGLFLALLPVSYLLIPKDRPYEKPKQEVELRKLIFSRPLLLDGFVVVLAMIAITFLEPVLSEHLVGFGVSLAIVGLMFTIPTVSYAMTAFFIGKLPKSIHPKAIMVCGLIISAVSLLLIGPWPYLGLPRSLLIVNIGLIVLGVGIGACILPVLPDMVAAAKETLPGANPEHVSDATSGLMTSYFFLGEIAGPPIAGFLKEQVGFEQAAAIVSLITLGYILVFGVCGGAFEACFCLRKDLNRSLAETLRGEEEMVMTTSGNREEELM